VWSARCGLRGVVGKVWSARRGRRGVVGDGSPARANAEMSMLSTSEESQGAAQRLVCQCGQCTTCRGVPGQAPCVFQCAVG